MKITKSIETQLFNAGFERNSMVPSRFYLSSFKEIDEINIHIQDLTIDFEDEKLISVEIECGQFLQDILFGVLYHLLDIKMPPKFSQRAGEELFVRFPLTKGKGFKFHIFAFVKWAQIISEKSFKKNVLKDREVLIKKYCKKK